MTRDELITEVNVILDNRWIDPFPPGVDSRGMAGEILSHPRISRALTLLDRIGEEAADALIAGAAAVVRKEMQEHPRITFRSYKSWLTAGRLDRGGA